ncbi:DUF2789 domain-containing protein [Uliginosibacterium sp. H3]|uniref:DUF2789 domain-containing protein n=1 Tax=Uliginosibacterium silvisoli TaxID=3114758 RepID=A0ABU6JYQ3_9RHOO|nr:DUF2789 domain-containing protein [Uliginosibacterium sp. H3]
METTEHSFANLFAQLGLANDEESIQAFIQEHSPLHDSIDLHCAPFWTVAQANMIRESLKADSDWAIAVDQLNVSLRAR